MKPITLIAATAGGGRLFAVVDTRAPETRLGALDHSEEIAALVPYASRDRAVDAMLKLGVEKGAIAER